MTEEQKGLRPNPPSVVLQALVIWAAMLASQAMIVLISQTSFVALTGASAAPASAIEAGGVPQATFFVIGFVLALGAYLLPKLLTKPIRRRFANRDAQINLRELSQAVLPVWILRWALLDAVTIMGFLAAMLYANPSAIFPFAMFSFMGFVLTFPNEERLRRTLLT